MMAWVRENDTLLWILAAASVLTFVGTLVGLPMLIARIPHDYFCREHTRLPGPDIPRRGVRIAATIAKNLLGLAFILVGLALLMLPGQGVLMILAGLVLSDFPGKFRLERWLVSRRSISRAINWMRRRAGKPPLLTPTCGD